MDGLDLIDWDIIETDGTISSANASKRMTGNHADFMKKFETYDGFSKKLVDRIAYVAKREAEGKMTQAEAQNERKKIERQEKVYTNTMDKIKEFDKEVKEFTVSASFIEDFDLWNAYKEKMKSPDGIYMYNRRIGKEHNNQDLKSAQNMGRLFRRGKERINLEVILHGIGHNLRKLGKYLREKEIQWAIS